MITKRNEILFLFKLCFPLLYSYILVWIIIICHSILLSFLTRPNPLPGPFPLPILGNIHQKIGYEYINWLMTLHKKYGDMYKVYLSEQRIIILCNENLI